MNVVAPEADAAPPEAGRLPARVRQAGTASRSVAAALAIVLLGLLSAYLRSRALGASFWIDEGLSVGIASHPLADIPHLLRQDGSPPLYYLLLHVWIGFVGDNETRTHLLSLGFALLCIPAGWWAARGLFGARAGWVAAVLFALNPFLTAYAQETRMYTLLVLLTLLASASFVQGFVFGRRRYLALFTLALTAMLYTHNWSWFFAIASGVALLACLRQHDDRGRLLRDAAIAYGAAALLVAPWIPTLLEQARNTGAPWAIHPHLASLENALYGALGDGRSAMVLLMAAGAGLAAMRVPRERAVVVTLLILGLGVPVLGFAYSQSSLAWASRYLALAVAPLVLLAAGGLTRSGRLGVAGLALTAFFWLGMPSPASLQDKSNVERLARHFGAHVRPGDLVISTQPEQVPNLVYYLPAGLRYATTLGRVPDPRIMDWRDGLDRLRTTESARTVRALVGSAAPGSRILVVAPVTRTSWRAPWTRLVRTRSRQWLQRLSADPSLRRIAGWRPSGRSNRSTVHGILYRKRARPTRRPPGKGGRPHLVRRRSAEGLDGEATAPR